MRINKICKHLKKVTEQDSDGNNLKVKNMYILCQEFCKREIMKEILEILTLD